LTDKLSYGILRYFAKGRKDVSQQKMVNDAWKLTLEELQTLQIHRAKSHLEQGKGHNPEREVI
jgi:hypothetical protein